MLLALLLAAPASAQELTLQYWHINTEAFGLPALRQLLREFERRNPGIRVEERYQQRLHRASPEPPSGPGGGQPARCGPDRVPLHPVRGRKPPLRPGRRAGPQVHRRTPPRGLRPQHPRPGDGQGADGGGALLPLQHRHLLQRGPLPPGGPGPRPTPGHLGSWRRAARQIKARTGKYGLYLILLDDNWAVEALIRSNGGSFCAARGASTARGWTPPRRRRPYPRGPAWYGRA